MSLLEPSWPLRSYWKALCVVVLVAIVVAPLIASSMQNALEIDYRTAGAAWDRCLITELLDVDIDSIAIDQTELEQLSVSPLFSNGNLQTFFGFSLPRILLPST